MTESKKNKRNKLLLPIVVIVLVMAAFVYVGFSGVPSPGATQTTAAPRGEPAVFTTTGANMLSNGLETELPYYESVNLEPGRYSVQVSSSNPVWIRVYDEVRFNAWQSAKSNGSTKAGTNLGESDKVTSFNRNFDVGEGEEGKYYLLIWGSGVTSLQFTITQILSFD